MREKLDIDERLLAEQLEEQYGIPVERIIFIPFGDSAYSYQAVCRDGERYYLKLFDRNNERQLRGIANLDQYLPLTSQMYREGLFINLACPIETAGGDLKSELGACTAVLFDFIEGETLAEAYPFPDHIVDRVAELIARLHLTTPGLAPSALLTDTFDLSCLDELRLCISDLEHAGPGGDPLLAAVRRQVLDKRNTIYELMDLVRELRSCAVHDGNSPVLCHGDVWGGNLILRSGELIMLDWESMQVAPRELDFIGYIGEEFERFYTAYTRQLGYAVTLNSDILRFYSYRHHLRNLNNWLGNILYGNLDGRQKENDLEMIRDHCMDRWDLVEPRIAQMEAVLRRVGGI